MVSQDMVNITEIKLVSVSCEREYYPCGKTKQRVINIPRSIKLFVDTTTITVVTSFSAN